jgi:hypothetical protein
MGMVRRDRDQTISPEAWEELMDRRDSVAGAGLGGSKVLRPAGLLNHPSNEADDDTCLIVY